jgi:hypothetical protein
MIPYTIAAFILFVIYVEGAALLIHFKSMKTRIYKTLGRADWVYPVVRETQEWMRPTVTQTYK